MAGLFGSNSFRAADIYPASSSTVYNGSSLSDIQLVVNESILRVKSDLHLKMFEEAVKFFDIDYGTGSEIMNLAKSNDEANKLIATKMLFSSVKENIKQDIIKEINGK